MKIKSTHFLFALYIVISLACNSIAGLPGGEALPEEAGTNAPPLTASGNGPQGFTAEATSADSVLLTWQPVEGATYYHIQVMANGDEALTVIDLAPTATSYEDFLAPPESELTYAVEAIGDAGSIGQSITQVTTPARQPNPLQMFVEFDDTSKVSQIIGPAGGTISVTDGMGVFYELIIPADALDRDVEISLTPVADLSSWPLDGEMIGVVGIEPEGVVLNEAAILGITPVSEISDDGQAIVGFSFQGYGDEFSLQPLTDLETQSGFLLNGNVHLARPIEPSSPLKPKMINVPVQKLGPKGAGKASAERAGEIVKNNPPSESGAAIDQKQAASSAADEDVYVNLSTIKNFQDYRRKIKQASDCDGLTTAVVSLRFAIERANRAGDQSSTRSTVENQAWNDTIEKTKEVMDKAAEECKKKKQGERKFTSAPCAGDLAKNISGRDTPFWNEYRRRMTEKYGEDAMKDAMKKIEEACKPGFTMWGGTEGLKVNDNVCDITKSFSVHGSVYGGAVTIIFYPASSGKADELPSGGVYSYTGSASGAGALGGEGTFKMSGDIKSQVMLNAYGPGQAGGHSASGGEAYVLTRVEYACASE